METGEGLVAVVVIVVALFIVAFLWELARRTWYWTAAKIYGWSEEEELVSLLLPAGDRTAHCRSLISHSRLAVSLSCASGLGGLCSWSKKYTPLTFATSGEVASHTSVSAPFSGLRDTGLRIVIPKSISTAQGGSSSPSPQSHRGVAPVQW
jgi:hypothetical protein